MDRPEVLAHFVLALLALGALSTTLPRLQCDPISDFESHLWFHLAAELGDHSAGFVS